MNAQANRYKYPSNPNNSDDTERKIGFELEFSGLDLTRATQIVAETMVASVQAQTVAECELRSDTFGNFTVELDWEYIKRKAAEEVESGESSAWLETLSDAANALVPIEVACPPVPLSRLDQLDGLVSALRDAGAAGTDTSLLAAYGLHINAEIPRLEPETINAYITAFGLLQWWLAEAHDVDISRKASFYVPLYTEDYVKQVLSHPSPTMDDIFADYLEHNASRNRALDLLPILASIDQERVATAVGDQKIKPRPALHYRLPNCNIHREDWFLWEPWNIWWVVEELAANPNARSDLGAEYLAADTTVFGVNRANWVEFVDRWLEERGLA